MKKILGFKAILHGHAPFHKLSQLGIAIWAYHRVVDAIGISHISYSLVDDETAERDLNMSIELLQSYGINLVSFAFPYNLMGGNTNSFKARNKNRACRP